MTAHNDYANLVLLAEDDDDDTELTRLAFDQCNVPISLERVRNGQECMDYLRRSESEADVREPSLILLDLNMPIMGGREVLSAIVADEKLRRFPVVILTTSSADEDVLGAYRLRCNSYIVKPLDFTQFVQAIHSLSEYWFKAATLPAANTG